LRVLEGLEDVAEGLGDPSPRERGAIRMSGQVDHGNLHGIADFLGGIDAVQLAVELNVHQYQVRARAGREQHRIVTPGGNTDDSVPDSLQLLLDVSCDDE